MGKRLERFGEVRIIDEIFGAVDWAQPAKPMSDASPGIDWGSQRMENSVRFVDERSVLVGRLEFNSMQE